MISRIYPEFTSTVGSYLAQNMDGGIKDVMLQSHNKKLRGSRDVFADIFSLEATLPIFE